MKCIEDEIPFELPDGWVWCRLSQTIMLYSGQDLIPSRYNDEGKGIPYITGASNLENKRVIINRWTETPTTHASKGDLLLTCKGSGVGKMAWCDIDDAHIARQIMALRCVKGLHPEYLELLMSAMITSIKEKANGLIPGLSRDVILDILSPIPPASEQERIVQGVTSIVLLIDQMDHSKAEFLDAIRCTKSRILDLAIRGRLVPQDPEDEPASVLLERIRAEKEEIIKQGKIKRDKKESVIFRGEDNSYYEKIGDEVCCVDDEIPFEIPLSWKWIRLEDCCIKEIRRGKAPKYVDESGTLVFAQKCNTKFNGIHVELALFLDERTLGKYPDNEYMQDGDVVINSTGTGTLGRVGLYKADDNPHSLPIVPDSHVTVVRSAHAIQPFYLYAYIKTRQGELEQMGEGSTNQKELKPNAIRSLLVPIPPIAEQERIASTINETFSLVSAIEKSLN